jgi:hypothetical protein
MRSSLSTLCEAESREYLNHLSRCQRQVGSFSQKAAPKALIRTSVA